MKKILIVLIVLFLPPLFFSCSYGEETEDERTIEVERTIADTTTNKNDTNDTTKSVIVVKDTVRLSYERYMRLQCTVLSAQGAACYGKYLIQCFAGNDAMEVFDLDEKEYVCKIVSPYQGKKTHANTVFFGNQRVSPDDYFPLLYICSGYSSNVNKKPCSFIHAYRIIKYDNADGSEGWNAEYVFTITLSGFSSWTEGVIDNDKNILWIKDRGCYYSSFKMPNYEDGNVTINRNEAITFFTVGTQPFSSSNQGHLFYDNKILLVSGTSPSVEKLAFIVINIKTQTRELVIDLPEIGLSNEPENLFLYKDQLMIGYRGSIYKFILYPKNK